MFINADKAYPVLNISQALAIMLYEFSEADFEKEYSFMSSFYADSKYQSRIVKLFMRMIARDERIKDKATVAMAFRHVLRRTPPHLRKEINALAVALSDSKTHRHATCFFLVFIIFIFFGVRSILSRRFLRYLH